MYFSPILSLNVFFSQSYVQYGATIKNNFCSDPSKITGALETQSFMAVVRGDSSALKNCWFKQRGGYALISCPLQSSKLILQPFAKTTNLWNNRSERSSFIVITKFNWVSFRIYFINLGVVVYQILHVLKI